ncbi:MAG TPA: glutathione-disulfide reductase [Rhizobacter sp.]|nr:glutathione-disulfide reductase [Rhizobacter sp.]
MSGFDCDLFVIGAGSGGVRASRMAAQRGAKVVLAEAGALGGTCVNVGCIPKKLYSFAAHYGEFFEEARGFGWKLEKPVFDWARLKQRRAAEIKRLNGIYEGLLKGAGVQLILGFARLIDAHTVAVRSESGEQRIRAKNILLATGGKPVTPAGPGAEWAVTSDDMFDLEPFPKRLLVVGAGYIACEFASIFQGLGAQVTLVHRGPQLLRGFDAEMATFLATEMQKKGVAIHLQTTVADVEKAGGVQRVKLSSGETVEADTVLHATGRRPNTAGLGVAELGLELMNNGALPVNEQLQTPVPSLYALGDLVGRRALTPVALAEAMYLVDHVWGPAAGKAARGAIDYALVPTAVFTHPNVGTVGLSEEQARKQYPSVSVYRSEFKALQHTLSESSERTLMKLLVDDASDRVLGLHMVGGEAGEVIQGFAVALQGGLTKAQLDRTLGIHPSVAEEFVTMREPLRQAS